MRPRSDDPAGRPAGRGRPLLLAGKIDFYMGGNMLQAFDAVAAEHSAARGCGELPEGPAGDHVASRPGLDKWEDLQKAEQYIIGDEGATSYLLWMERVRLGSGQARCPTPSTRPFIANEKSIQQGYVTSEPYAIEKEGGFVPNQFLIADYGYDSYSTTIEAMQDTIDKRPEAVQCFVMAPQRAEQPSLRGQQGR